jgi:hypothetical protein
MLFGAAVALYVLWVAALVTMTLVSGARPADARRPIMLAPADSRAGRDVPAK